MKQNPNTRVQIESQTAVLGCMLIDARTHGDIFAKIHDRDFSSEHFRNIFRAARQIFHEGKPLDAVTLLHQLGEEYRQTLTEIIEVTPTAANCSEYIDLLLESAKLGRLQELGLQLTQAATLQEASMLAGRLAEIETYNSGMQAVPISKGIADFFERQTRKPEYIQLGITKIDQQLFAELGDYIVLGGRPSDGKTALALQIALTLSRKYRVGIFSLETKQDKLYDRLLTNACILDFSKVKKREMSEDDFARIAASTGDLSGHDLDVISAAGRTIDEIQSYPNTENYDYLNTDFVGKLDDDIQAVVKQVKIPYNNQTRVYSGSNGASCRAFLISCYEAGCQASYSSAAVEVGSCLSFFKGTSQSDEKRLAYFNGVSETWWTRDNSAKSNRMAMRIAKSGGSSAPGTFGSEWMSYYEGIRPALVLPFELYVDDDGNVTTEEPRTIEFQGGVDGVNRAVSELDAGIDGVTRKMKEVALGHEGVVRTSVY